ncbi:MAG: hypothetical protein GY805_09050 [Chloroflexi bacterium]|nr:hypothetical protein [Chloroflexota bacterium]
MQNQGFNRHNLRKFLIENFSEDDIRDICFDLTIDFESLSGSNKPSKIRELVIFCEQQGYFETLVKTIYHARPNNLIEDFLANEMETTHRQIESSIYTATTFQNVAESIDLLFINEKEGIFELEEIWIEKFKEATNITTNLAQFTRAYTQDISELTNDIKLLQDSKHKPSKNDMKKIINNQASILNNYATKVAKKLDTYEDTLSKGLIAFLRESTIHVIDFKKPGRVRVKFLLLRLKDLILSSKLALHGDQSMMNSIQNIPRTTSAIVNAKRKTLVVLENQITARSRIHKLMNTIEKLLTQMLDETIANS